jgi:uncharacterized membrane protein YphA (DoxX/SURF4 family)
MKTQKTQEHDVSTAERLAHRVEQVVDKKREGQMMRYVRWFMSLVFLLAGLAKIGGADVMQQTFARFEYPMWFMLLIGVLETAGAIGLLIPGLIRWAALGLSGIMIGAITSHLAYDPVVMALPAIVAMFLLISIARQHAQFRAVAERRNPSEPSSMSRHREHGTPHQRHAEGSIGG